MLYRLYHKKSFRIAYPFLKFQYFINSDHSTNTLAKAGLLNENWENDDIGIVDFCYTDNYLYSRA